MIPTSQMEQAATRSVTIYTRMDRIGYVRILLILSIDVRLVLRASEQLRLVGLWPSRRLAAEVLVGEPRRL